MKLDTALAEFAGVEDFYISSVSWNVKKSGIMEQWFMDRNTPGT